MQGGGGRFLRPLQEPRPGCLLHHPQPLEHQHQRVRGEWSGWDWGIRGIIIANIPTPTPSDRYAPSR